MSAHDPIARNRPAPSPFRRVYAGIGSRETPDDVLHRMRTIAGYLARKGWTLRSGAADGADSAFEEGARAAGGACEIWLPWLGFNGNPSKNLPSPAAFGIAAELHPAWEHLARAPRLLHARNCHQVLGADLATPADFIICWTRGGLAKGGTGQSLRLAERHAIPVFNLAVEGRTDELRDFLKTAVQAR